MGCLEQDCGCIDFEPNPFKPERCKNCMHTHEAGSASDSSKGATSIPSPSRENAVPAPAPAPSQPAPPAPSPAEDHSGSSGPEHTVEEAASEKDLETEKESDAVSGDLAKNDAPDDTQGIQDGKKKVDENSSNEGGGESPEKDGSPTATGAGDNASSADARMCSGCGGAIDRQDWVSANEKEYHTHCFLCKSCGCSLGGQSFAMAADGAPRCVPCFEKENAVVCAACGDAIEGSRIVVDTPGTEGKKEFHKECFKCSKCDAALAGGAHFIDAEGGSVCEKCAGDIDPHQGKPCSACGESIEGDAIKAIGEFYHINCFKCTVCDGNIGGTEFLISPEGKPLHKGCENGIPNPAASDGSAPPGSPPSE